MKKKFSKLSVVILQELLPEFLAFLLRTPTQTTRQPRKEKGIRFSLTSAMAGFNVLAAHFETIDAVRTLKESLPEKDFRQRCSTGDWQSQRGHAGTNVILFLRFFQERAV